MRQKKHAQKCILALFIIETQSIKMKCEKNQTLTTARKGYHDPCKKVTKFWKEAMAFSRKITNYSSSSQRPPPSSYFISDLLSALSVHTI